MWTVWNMLVLWQTTKQYRNHNLCILINIALINRTAQLQQYNMGIFFVSSFSSAKRTVWSGVAKSGLHNSTIRTLLDQSDWQTGPRPKLKFVMLLTRAERLISFAIMSRYEKTRFFSRRGDYTRSHDTRELSMTDRMTSMYREKNSHPNSKRFREGFKSDRLNHLISGMHSWRNWTSVNASACWNHICKFYSSQYVKKKNVWEHFIGYMTCNSQIWQR